MPQLIKALASTHAANWSIDWLAIWALFLSVVAVSVASYVYFADEAPIAAAFVLAAFAAIMGVVLRETTQRHDHG